MDVLILISIYILRKEKFEFFSLAHFYIFTTSPIHMNIYRWTFYNSEEKDGFRLQMNIKQCNCALCTYTFYFKLSGNGNTIFIIK